MTSEHLAHRTDAVRPAADVAPAGPAFGGSDLGRLNSRNRPVVKALIAANTVVAVIGLVLLAFEGGLTGSAALMDGVSSLHEWGEMDGRAVDRGQAWRLVTSMFVHYGLLHLAVNMVMLGLAGWRLEPLLGSRRFLGLYLLSGFAAGAATYLFSHDALTAGASGATFGTFAALFVVSLRLGLPKLLPAVLVMLGVVATFAIPGMAIAAHAAGLLVGAIVAAGYAYPADEQRTRLQRVVPAGTLVVLLVVLAAAVLLG